MALTLATELANYAAGIGTQGATLKIDSANKRVGVGTTNPQGPEGSLQVGTGITFFGNTGIISAIGGKFSGDFTVGGTLTYEDVQNVNSSGVGTFSGGINVVGGGLTVTGVSTFFSRVSIADSIVHTGDINTSLRFPAADTFTVETAGSEALRVDSSGNVGIGTDTIEANANYNTLQISGTTDTTGGGIVRLKTGDLSAKTMLFCDTGGFEARVETNHPFVVSTNGSNERLRITSAGNVGIKTDTPAAPLHVDSDNAYGSFVLSRDGGVSGRRPFGFGISGATDANFRISASGDTLSENAFDNQIIDITAAGLVGIGSAIPEVDLVVRSSKASAAIAKDGLTVKASGDLHTSYDTLQIGAGGALLSYSTATATADTQLVHNAYRSSGGSFKYRYADTAARLRVNSPGRKWIFDSAASGSADADITFTEQLSIDVSGNLNAAGIATATQLFEGTSRVATAGKAVAMALVFG